MPRNSESAKSHKRHIGVTSSQWQIPGSYTIGVGIFIEDLKCLAQTKVLASFPPCNKGTHAPASQLNHCVGHCQQTQHRLHVKLSTVGKKTKALDINRTSILIVPTAQHTPKPWPCILNHTLPFASTSTIFDDGAKDPFISNHGSLFAPFDSSLEDLKPVPGFS